MTTKTLPPRPPPCWRCRIALLLIGAAVVASFVYLGIDYRALGSAESLKLMGRFVAEFFPPDMSPDFLAKVGHGALQTLAVSALGTVLAALAGAVLALPASGRAGWMPRHVARFALNFLRSVPELVFCARNNPKQWGHSHSAFKSFSSMPIDL